LARCLDVETVLLDQVAAIGQDGVGVLQHLQPLEVIGRRRLPLAFPLPRMAAAF
jgi:hypothetical protein